MSPKVGFIGAGKVGTSLGKVFAERKVEVTGYFSRSIQSAKEAATFTNSRVYDTAGAVLKDSDVLFITVPDGAISDVYSALPRELLRGKIICHSSGAMRARDAFPCIEKAGAYGYSVHPLFAVSDRFTSWREMMDVFFTIEGSEARLDEMMGWLTSLGLHVAVIDGNKKALYHAAAAIASNHVVALFAEARDMLAECGFPPNEASAALLALFLGNAHHIAEVGPEAALTGPVERGDDKTVAKHLSAITDADDRALYRLITRRLVRLAQSKHPDRDYTAIENIINDEKDGTHS